MTDDLKLELSLEEARELRRTLQIELQVLSVGCDHKLTGSTLEKLNMAIDNVGKIPDKSDSKDES